MLIYDFNICKNDVRIDDNLNCKMYKSKKYNINKHFIKNIILEYSCINKMCQFIKTVIAKIIEYES